MEKIILTKILKGFKDSLPNEEIFKSNLIENLTGVYRSYGFVPIDTPALEYTDILLRKSNGETEKQVFRFNDNGGRDISLRFDLTVPFARFVAEHKNELYFPFKRYHIAKVWRGEKPQAGRYREFTQCDFDIIGSDSAYSDFEILSLMKESLKKIGVDNIVIHLNHLGIFKRFLNKIGCIDKSNDILRLVDKKQKIEANDFINEMVELVGKKNADLIMDYITPRQDFILTLKNIEKLAGGPEKDTQRIKDIYLMITTSGIEEFYTLDPSITRGLDYYTGIVYETFLTKMPSIGSICSGGRYDNLAGLYINEKITGVGASIGIDRLIAGLTELNTVNRMSGSYIDIEIYNTDNSLMPKYILLANKLRDKGLSVEIFPDTKKMSQQYAVTDKKNIPYGIFLTKDDIEKNTFTLKNLKNREVIENIDI